MKKIGVKVEMNIDGKIVEETFFFWSNEDGTFDASLEDMLSLGIEGCQSNINLKLKECASS